MTGCNTVRKVALCGFGAVLLIALAASVPILFKARAEEAVSGPRATISPRELHLKIDARSLPTTPVSDHF